VLGVREDGQKVLLAVKNMGGETNAAQPLLDRAQLGIIECPGRLLPIAGNKGTVAPLSSNETAAATCCSRTPSSSVMRRLIGFIDPEL
jgi:hypothetical protein